MHAMKLGTGTPNERVQQVAVTVHVALLGKGFHAKSIKQEPSGLRCFVALGFSFILAVDV